MCDTHVSLKRVGSARALLAAVLGILLTTMLAAHAQTLTTLYSFAGGEDGAFPEGGLVLDSQGNLYGTTIYGGAHLKGTVFELTPSSNETVLHSFGSRSITTLCFRLIEDGWDGAFPNPGLTVDSQGNLYGTTHGGDICDLGTVFRVSSSGAEKVLYRFSGGANGANPGGLISDSQGNLYGATQGGLTRFCCGTIFEVTSSGTEKTLYRFTGGADGNIPLAGLVLDSSGNLYGTTIGGGAYGYGTVFKLTPDGTETVLFSFQFSESSVGNLALDSGGNLYGVTGNAHNGGAGGGSIFKLTSTGTKTVLYSFTGPDGDGPSGVILDKQGNLYGTTANGGVGAGCVPVGCGVVFQVTPNGTEKVLYNFTGAADGADPFGVLVLDSQGNLYGTTAIGGSGSACNSGCGTVFKLTR